MRIFFAAGEAAPLVKVGGLGDVTSALTKELARHGHEVWLLIPRYRGLPRTDPIWRTRVRFAGTEVAVDVSGAGTHHGVGYLAVGYPSGLEWLGSGGYQDGGVLPYLLLSRAVAEFARHPDWPGDVLHCHDWQFAHAVAYLARSADPGAGCRTVLTIHNLAYQGRLPARLAADLRRAGYPEDTLLAQGISCADVVTTVSGRYREETLTPAHGNGLDPLLNGRGADYRGILNGLDYDEFNPATDPYLPFHYDVENLAGKAQDKAELQRISGLPGRPDVPVLGFVGRLVRQKGPELLLAAADRLAGRGVQLVVVGRGAEFEAAFEQARERCPDLAFHPDSSEQMARLLYAGSDLLLAPSAFEPCGLAPLIALRYGSVPVVHHIGGMAETVGDTRLGFSFADYAVDPFVQAITGALAHWRAGPAWRVRQAAGMRARFGWDDAIAGYLRAYHPAGRGDRGPDAADGVVPPRPASGVG